MNLKHGFGGSVVVFGLIAAAAAHAGYPVLDGGGFGAPSATVAYDPNAPYNNFGTPTQYTNAAAYNIYTRSDASYMYVMVSETGAGAPAISHFANLYFGTGSSATSTSDVGFEVTNSDVFVPGGAAPVPTPSATGIEFAVLNGSTSVEFAVPFSYFETDPQAIGFDKVTSANPDIILRLSQSFGYSVAGGDSYGTDRLGLFVAVRRARAGARFVGDPRGGSRRIRPPRPTPPDRLSKVSLTRDTIALSALQGGEGGTHSRG